MNRSTAPTARAQDEPTDIDEEREEDEGTEDGSDEGADSPARTIHDVLSVPNYPSKSTRSGLIRNGGGVEIALCSSWVKQCILLSLFRPVYQVILGFQAARPVLCERGDGTAARLRSVALC